MIISLEEAIKQGHKIAGMGQRPDFVFSSRTNNDSYKNVLVSNELEEVLSNYLSIENYSKEKIKHLTFIFIVLPSDHKGVDWKERKSYSRNDKILRMEIKFPDYERFCKAEKPEVLQIMAEQTLRGIEVFLSKEKDFDYPKFYVDVKELFRMKGWIVE